MELTDQQIEFLKSALLANEKELQETIDLRKDSTKPVSLDDPIGRLSRMDSIQQQKMAEESQRRAALQLQQVQSALGRMADGAYGDCLKCEEPIHWGRLKTKPESTLCLSCQQRSESEGE